MIVIAIIAELSIIHLLKQTGDREMNNDKHGDLENWTKTDLARTIVKFMFKLDRYPPATDIRVKRHARNTKAVLIHRAEIALTNWR